MIFPKEHKGMVLIDRTGTDGLPQASVFGDGGLLLGHIRYLRQLNRYLAMIGNGTMLADGQQFATFDEAMDHIAEKGKP